MPNVTARIPLLLSIGSNHRAELQIPMVLEHIEKAVHILSTSHPLRTKPINFPYPSQDFINLLIYAESDMSLDALVQWSKALEVQAGRTIHLRTQHPELIPLDIDIVLWGDALLRPQDLQRYYIPKALDSMGLRLVGAQGKYSLQSTQP